MAMRRMRAAAVGATLLVGACAFADQALIPAMTGEKPEPAATTSAPASEAPAASTAPAVVPAGDTAPVTASTLGAKVATLADEHAQLQSSAAAQSEALQRLRRQSAEHALAYHATVGAIAARLQSGAAPGDAGLRQQWSVAQGELGRMQADLGETSSLANQVAGNVAFARYLQESARAMYRIAGAPETDYQQLQQLDDAVNGTAVQVDRLLAELGEDVARQSGALAAEQNNLVALSMAVNAGQAQAFAAPAAPTAAPPGAGIAGGRPFVVIRFDRPDVEYRQALYEAVSKALERRPTAAFDLVAVAGVEGNGAAAQQNAEEVLRALNEMGLPPDRIALSAATSQQATGNEVHLYVR